MYIPYSKNILKMSSGKRSCPYVEYGRVNKSRKLVDETLICDLNSINPDTLCHTDTNPIINAYFREYMIIPLISFVSRIVKGIYNDLSSYITSNDIISDSPEDVHAFFMCILSKLQDMDENKINTMIREELIGNGLIIDPLCVE